MTSVISDQSPSKKAKLVLSEGSIVSVNAGGDGTDTVTASINTSLNNLGVFSCERVLRVDASQKVLALQARVEHSQSPAVVILEKTSFTEEQAPDLLTSATQLKQLLHNDIYGSYCGTVPADLNSLKVTIIHPATSKHIDKHSSTVSFLVDETPQLYRDALLAYLAEKSFKIDWVYNILEHKSESDRIVYEDTHSENGFVILPDLKWDGQTMASLYLVAIVRRRDLRSIRDLTADHLPLLRNIASSGINAVVEKYGLHRTSIRAFFHYLPSYYHLHVHITSIHFDAPGRHVGKAHLLSSVISNIELVSDYYQRATLSYFVRQNDSLVQFYRKAGYDIPSTESA